MSELGYYDYDHCALSFCAGQKDARPYEQLDTLWRMRGRSVLSATLVRFEDADVAWRVATRLKRDGIKVSSLSWSLGKPEHLPTLPGPVEWELPAPSEAWKTGEKGRRARAALRSLEPCNPTLEEALEVFQEWVSWAQGRHFMVFKGHYKAWIERWYKTEGFGRCRLIGLRNRETGVLEAVFGAERHPTRDEWEVVVAKHRPSIRGRDMWMAGLMSICPTTPLVRLSSTADELKKQLGASPAPSWKFDFSKLEI